MICPRFVSQAAAFLTSIFEHSLTPLIREMLAPSPAIAARASLASVILALAASPMVQAQHGGQPGHANGGQQSVFSGEVTVTATGAEETTDEVPVAVTVITREEIDDAQEESVAELLRRAPGLTVLRAGGEGSATSLFMRGTESDHTLAMFDGVRLTSPYFGGFDWSLIPTAGLERIEVARGPFSALWGADAIGGVVNVVPAAAGPGFRPVLLAEAGEDGWSRMEGGLAWSDGGLDLYASGLDSEGRGELPNSDFASRQLLVDAGWSWAEGSRVAVLIQDLDTELGIPFADPLSPTPNRRQAADQRLLAVPLRLRASEHWSIEVVASRVERELMFRDPDDPFGFTASDTSSDTSELRLASRHRLGSHSLTWGVGWREDAVDDASSYGINLDDQRAEVASAFLQEEWQLASTARVIGGVRWDEADEWGSELSPRVAVGWRPVPALELRAGYGQAFRQPSIGELYFPFSGNPELEAETSSSFDAGVSWLVGDARLELSLFSTEIENLIDFDYATYSFANTARAEARGAELAWEVPLSSRIASSLQVTWLDTQDQGGQPLLRRPEWSGAWTVRGALAERLRGDVTLIWVGSRPDVDAVSFERIELEDHVTAHIALAYEVLDDLELTLRVRNLADETYEEIAGYPAPGRRLIGGLRWRP